jgi:WD40 repeat protein
MQRSPNSLGYLESALSSDGTILASVSETDRTIRIWDTSTGYQIRALKGELSLVSCLAFSPARRFLFSASWFDPIQVWDVLTGKEVRRLGGHKDEVSLLAISPNGRWLASASKHGLEDGQVGLRLWDLRTFLEVRTLTLGGGALSAQSIFGSRRRHTFPYGAW